MPRLPGFSSHAAGLSDQLYSPLVARARASGRTIHPLHIGDTFREPFPGAMAEQVRGAEHPLSHAYPPVQGEPVLREAFARHLTARRGVSLDPAALQVTAGATSGIAAVVQTLLDVGDEVLVPAPYWPLLRGVIAARGAVPVEVPFFDRLADPGFDPEQALESAITERTAALYLNSPNNPSGVALDRAQLDAALRVAIRHDLWIVFDEAYADLTWSGALEAPYLDPAIRERSVVLHTLSKSHGLAGARIGFLHGAERVTPALRGMQMHLAYCAPRPMQFAAARALDEGQGWVEETRALYADGARRTAEVLGARIPDGGTFVFVDVGRFLPEGARDCMPFLEACADRGVLLTPGSVSGSDYARFARICFTSVAPPALADALSAIAEVVSRGREGADCGGRLR